MGVCVCLCVCLCECVCVCECACVCECLFPPHNPPPPPSLSFSVLIKHTVVVLLCFLWVEGLLDAWSLVEVTGKPQNVWKVNNALLVALEMRVVHQIKANLPNANNNNPQDAKQKDKASTK